ncbi:MAG: hypothetical protein AAF531_17555 [Actinomycetota bacterium]
MGIIRRRLTGRFSTLGLLSDLALVGTAANRLLQRRNGSTAAPASATELALAGGAAFRLLQRLRRRRKRRKAAA